jgi:hypothetical protein
VLVAVRQLGAEAVLSRPPGQRLDEVTIGTGRAQGRVEVLASQREGMSHPGVTGPEDHEQVGLAPLGQVAIRPGVGRPAPVEVDVRRHQPVNTTAPEGRDGARAGRRVEEAVHRRA